MRALSESCAGIQLCSAASRRHLDLKQIKRIRFPRLSNSDLARIPGIYADNANKSNSNMALIPPTSAPVTGFEET